MATRDLHFPTHDSLLTTHPTLIDTPRPEGYHFLCPLNSWAELVEGTDADAGSKPNCLPEGEEDASQGQRPWDVDSFRMTTLKGSHADPKALDWNQILPVRENTTYES